MFKTRILPVNFNDERQFTDYAPEVGLYQNADDLIAALAKNRTAISGIVASTIRHEAFQFSPQAVIPVICCRARDVGVKTPTMPWAVLELAERRKLAALPDDGAMALAIKWGLGDHHQSRMLFATRHIIRKSAGGWFRHVYVDSDLTAIGMIHGQDEINPDDLIFFKKT